MGQSWETMTSVSAGHIRLALSQPVLSGHPPRESNPGSLPTELPPPPPRNVGIAIMRVEESKLANEIQILTHLEECHYKSAHANFQQDLQSNKKVVYRIQMYVLYITIYYSEQGVTTPPTARG